MLALLLLHLTASSVCRCDIIEFNRAPNIHQVIFWDWSHRDGRYNARGWLPVDKVEQIDQRTVKVGKWTVEGRIRFTETDHDPERENAKIHCDRNLMPWEVRK